MWANPKGRIPRLRSTALRAGFPGTLQLTASHPGTTVWPVWPEVMFIPLKTGKAPMTKPWLFWGLKYEWDHSRWQSGLTQLFGPDEKRDKCKRMQTRIGEMLFVRVFFLDYKTPKITLWIKPVILMSLFLCCALRPRYVGSLRDIFLALRHMEAENIKKAKIKSGMEQRNWLKQHKCSLMLQLVKKMHRVSWEKINGNL